MTDALGVELLNLKLMSQLTGDSKDPHYTHPMKKDVKEKRVLDENL